MHQPPPLSVKGIFGGGMGDKAWTPAIRSVQGAVGVAPGSDALPFGLTVTFLVPGEVYAAAFTGIRVNTFLDQHRTLVVQASLPPEPDQDAWLEVMDNLDRAIEKAESWGQRKKKLQGQLIEARSVAASLRDARPPEIADGTGGAP